jgi:plastocyanin
VKYSDFRSGLYRLTGPDDSHDFKARFRKRGIYRFVCQQHAGLMKMTVTVKR